MAYGRRQPSGRLSTKVVDVTLVVDNQKMAVGARLKAARAALGLTQKELCALIEKPLPSLRDYELGKSIPGGEAVAGLIRAGINANWLLTGEGPMLLAELARKEAQSPRINAEALSAILRGLLEAGAPPAKACTAAVEFYQISIDRGDITPDGIGDGQKAAA